MSTPETGVEPPLQQQQVVDTMAAVLGRLLETDQVISADTRVMEELGLSSTLGLEMLLELEETLAIQIDVELMDPIDMTTVGDLATFIAGHSRPY
jgi:acyl carrier protein